MLKTNNLQDIIYKSIADGTNVTITNLYLFILILIPSVATQLKFNEATQKNYKISYDEFLTERRLISDMIAQVDRGSAQQVKSTIYLI